MKQQLNANKKLLKLLYMYDNIISVIGGVAQLGERTVRIRKVMGSIPTVSTKKRLVKTSRFFIFKCVAATVLR